MKKVRNLVLMLILLTLTAIPMTSSAVDSIEATVIPPEIVEIIEEFQVTYRLTVKYIYLNGTQAAKSYVDHLNAGTAYSVSSPEIDGFMASTSVVSGKMPARDMQYTVIYIPIPQKAAAQETQPTDDAAQPEGTENQPEGTETQPEGESQPVDTANLMAAIFSDSTEYFMRIEDYEVPLGLGASMMNVGICAE